MERLKEQAGRKAAELIRDGMVVGLGSGTTAAWGIRALAERVAAGLRVTAVPTSDAAAALARAMRIRAGDLARGPVTLDLGRKPERKSGTAVLGRIARDRPAVRLDRPSHDREP